MISPRFLIKEYRDKAKFKCNSDTAPIWSLKGRKLPSDIKLYQNDSILVINSIKEHHVGSYYCWSYDSIYRMKIFDFAFLDIKKGMIRWS